MTSPTHDHTTPDTPPTRPTAADRVMAALEELDHASWALGLLPRTATDWATRSAAMALISARTAGWWRVLLSAERRTRTAHPVYRRAVSVAHRRALDDARFWRETAQDWRARVDRRPTSDAAGALSNWRELGVIP